MDGPFLQHKPFQARRAFAHRARSSPMSSEPTPSSPPTPPPPAQGGATHDQWQGARLLWSGLLCLLIIAGAIAIERCA
jgi:hypothetical protein